MDFTEFDEPAVSDPHTPARAEAPALLTTLRWSSAISPEAVLLSPADVRQTWMSFKQVRRL